jgi:hypothetical protein
MSIEILCVPMPRNTKLLQAIQKMPDNGFGAVKKVDVVRVLEGDV